MKILDFETIRSLAQNVNYTEYYDWIDYALKNKSEFTMPNKLPFGPKDKVSLAAAPVYWEKNNISSVKVLGRYELNGDEKRSRMMGDIFLYEGNTGVLKAVTDAVYITTLRTAAQAVHSTIMYSKKDFRVIGLIGLGNIMTAYIQILLSKIGSKNITIKLYKYKNQEKRIAKKFNTCKNVTFIECDTYDEIIKGSDVIVSAVSKVDKNFASDDCYDEGCTVIPIMTMGFQNCDLIFDKVFSDEVNQIKNFKYFDRFHSVEDTSDVLNGLAEGRKNNRERILVYDYGIAIHDLYFSLRFYDMCQESISDTDYRYCQEKYFM